MKRLPALFIMLFLLPGINASATIRLVALTNAGSPTVTLQWNMVNYPGNTAYILFKSVDGVTWQTAAANPVFRNYTASTILAYRDNFSDEQQLYYRVKVYDTNENIVEVSNTAEVANATSLPTRQRSVLKRSVARENSESTRGAAWQIYPNPVHDMLNLIYLRSEAIKGIISVIVQDATGKMVIRFRAASTNKQLHIPVSNLHAGVYFIKLNVENELQLSDKFIKQ